jgi:hypothetical protein
VLDDRRARRPACSTTGVLDDRAGDRAGEWRARRPGWRVACSTTGLAVLDNRAVLDNGPRSPIGLCSPIEPGGERRAGW